MKLSVEQIKKCKHALGLDYAEYKGKGRLSYRNYYNTGYQQDTGLDELVCFGLMTRRDVGKEMGGFYYYLTDKGIETMQTIAGPFEINHK